MASTPSARKRIVIALLCTAVAGALLRAWSQPASTLHDIGTLLMLLWLPVIGSVIAWLVARMRRPATPQPAAFEPGRAFAAHALVELTMRAPELPADDTPVAEGEHRCALVVGSEGFSARWMVPPGGAFRRGDVRTAEVEFSRPDAALPRFAAGTAFRMLVGESFVGDGRVLELRGR